MARAIHEGTDHDACQQIAHEGGQSQACSDKAKDERQA
jgi:hypothetical protein